jgi:ParB family chromosome partitioning protein
MANDEFFTPDFIIESARKVMGSIDLDPASCEAANGIVKATKFYTKEISGLRQDWAGNVWLNPPYSVGNMMPFVDKLVYNLGINGGFVTQAFLLCNAQTSAKWFHKALQNSDYMLIFDKRISFISADTMEQKKGNDRSQILFYYGRMWGKVEAEFRKYGSLMVTA